MIAIESNIQANEICNFTTNNISHMETKTNFTEMHIYIHSTKEKVATQKQSHVAAN